MGNTLQKWERDGYGIVMERYTDKIIMGLWLYHTRINSLDTHDLTVHHTRSLVTQSFLPREA